MKETKLQSSLQRQAAIESHSQAAITQRTSVAGLSSVSRSVAVLRQADSSVERQAIFRSVGMHGNAHAATVARQYSQVQRQTGGAAAPASGGGGQAALAQLGSKILSEAREWIGTPYSQTNPRKKGSSGRVDCSGLVQAAYQDGAGVALPRVSQGQASTGQLRNVKKPQAGDVIAFNSIPHVGISAGGNKMVDASKPGTKASERNIWTTDVTFRRLPAKK